MNVPKPAFISAILLGLLTGLMMSQVFNVIAREADEGSPFDAIWAAIIDLQSRVASLNSSNADLLRRVEALEYPSGFVGQWKFDEASGQVVYDESGNDNNGRIYGASWIEGKRGTALSFDGEGNYVDVMHSSTPYFNSVTVMAWVKLRTFPGYDGGVSMIVAKGTDDAQNGHFGLHQYYQGHSSTNPAIFHFYLRENNQFYAVDGTTHIVLGEWYHVAGTYDGSVLKLYVNGVLEDEETINVTRTHNIENLQIGALRMPKYAYWTDGAIDEVEVYKRALTAQEILEHFAEP
jgi:hypothetical protein